MAGRVSPIGPPAAFASELAQIERASERLDRIAAEVRRLRHLLGYPAVASGAARDLLENAPALDDPDAAEGWIARAEAAYRHHRERYRGLHDAWWGARSDTQQVLSWAPPAAPRSVHLDLGL
jgi:hypothetical protein